jgi:hypothetical protein
MNSIDYPRYQSPSFRGNNNFNSTSTGQILQPIKIKNKVWIPTGKQQFSKPTRLLLNPVQVVPRALYY